MADALFLAPDAMDVFVDYVGQYSAFGVGLGAVSFGLGYVVWFVIDVMRGGV